MIARSFSAQGSEKRELRMARCTWWLLQGPVVIVVVVVVVVMAVVDRG